MVLKFSFLLFAFTLQSSKSWKFGLKTKFHLIFSKTYFHGGWFGSGNFTLSLEIVFKNYQSIFKNYVFFTEQIISEQTLQFSRNSELKNWEFKHSEFTNGKGGKLLKMGRDREKGEKGSRLTTPKHSQKALTLLQKTKQVLGKVR